MSTINSIYSGGAFWGGAALASQIIGRVITDPTASGSYSKGFVIAAVIGVVGMALLYVALMLSPMKKKTLVA